MAQTPLVSLRDTRERTIAVLSDLFAKDQLELDEFERRVSLVHRAATVADVTKVIEDLPSALGEVKPNARTALVPAKEVRPTQTIAAILGGAVRRGAWTAPQHLRLVSFMGGIDLDFREARLPPGVTEVSVFTFMGGVAITVPPELSVEVSGTGIMGGFEHVDRQPPEADPDRPVLRVHGVAIMGGVSVETRLIGETRRDARRRERRERRKARRDER